ncbi:MAG TPA: outer membrane beta-barrel family protein, partial [Prolixibacteraceae bacterium]|nr:outer membrane beta-barrel family protein [Prolixibacteraceae bacterium]
ENATYKLDKKTIYVENQISGAGGSAADLLYKLPSVTHSPDGKISIHGNSNLLIYVNGKPSSLKGNELLENTTAAEIKKIELITSPSAKYDASGSGGIINLITKKSTRDGFNGNILVAADQLGGYSADFLLNYKYKKFSFFTGIDNNKRKNEGDVDYITKYLASQTQFTQTGIQKSQRINTGFRAGADYEPNKSDKISISGNAGTFETNNNGDWQTTETNLLRESIPYNSVTNDNNRLGNYGGADASYTHLFKSPDQHLSISTLWNTLTYDDQYLNLITDPNGTEQMKQTTYLDKKFRTGQFNTDFSTPAGNAGILEFGYQITLNKEQENYQSTRDIPNPVVVTKQETNFDEIIQAGYGTWQLNLDWMELKAGLRAEYLSRDLTTLQKSYPLHRFDLYPSLNSSFKIDSIQSILFNYTRRTDHLKTIQLDPLPRWYDFYNVMVGNPNLEYEITDKITLDYLVSFQNLTLASELFFYNTANKIEVIRSVYHDNIIQNKLENVGSEKSTGFELNANWSATKWLTLNQKIAVIDSRLDIRIDSLVQKRDYRQLYSVTTATVMLSPTMSVEADFTY